jgi:hypothetical protein
MFGNSCVLIWVSLLYLYVLWPGLYLGVKLFLVDYLFNRFPRLKIKYDSTYKMWMDLPTDAEFEKQSMKSEIDRVRILLPS